jgi:hypothetical protein
MTSFVTRGRKLIYTPLFNKTSGVYMSFAIFGQMILRIARMKVLIAVLQNSNETFLFSRGDLRCSAALAFIQFRDQTL